LTTFTVATKRTIGTLYRYSVFKEQSSTAVDNWPPSDQLSTLSTVVL